MSFLLDILNNLSFNKDERLIQKVAKATRFQIYPFNPLPGVNPAPNLACYSIIKEIFDINSDIKFDQDQVIEIITIIVNKYDPLGIGIGSLTKSTNEDGIFNKIELFPGQGASVNYEGLKNKLLKPEKYFLQCVPGFGATGISHGGNYFAFFLAIALHTLLREKIIPLTEEKILGRMKYLSSFSDYHLLK